MTRTSAPDLLVLHAVRTLGYADSRRVAVRCGLDEADVHERLLDAQACGWVVRSSFAGDQGWSLTEAGKEHGERLVAAELDECGAREVVEQVHADFLPLNHDVAAACTAWQLASLSLGDAAVTLSATIEALERPAAGLAALEHRLAGHLRRFEGYGRRFSGALAAAHQDAAWLTGTDRDSCHRVWFELHEDLIATLGLRR